MWLRRMEDAELWCSREEEDDEDESNDGEKSGFLCRFPFMGKAQGRLFNRLHLLRVPRLPRRAIYARSGGGGAA